MDSSSRWPGALIAQEMLRHKSKQASFRTVSRITVLMNCLALVCLQTEGGQAALHGFLA